MAYIGGQLANITQGTFAQFGASEAQGSIFWYTNTVDSYSTVTGTNYISDGQKRGMALGSLVLFFNGSSTTLLYVSALQATSSGYGVTLSPAGTGNGGIVLPANKYTTAALTAATLTAAQIAGASEVVLYNTGNTPGAQTLPSVATIVAAIPNFDVSYTYRLRIVNAGSGTLTFTQDSGATWTMPTHVSITTDTWVEYIFTFQSATAGTIYSIGSGVAP
jgi:hypothetical protein